MAEVVTHLLPIGTAIVTSFVAGFWLKNRLEKIIDDHVQRGVQPVRNEAENTGAQLRSELEKVRSELAQFALQVTQVGVVRTQLEETRQRVTQQEDERDQEYEELRVELAEIMRTNLDYTRMLASNVDSLALDARASRERMLADLQRRVDELGRMDAPAN